MPTETCTVCHRAVLVMTRKGSGICGQTCENIANPDHPAKAPTPVLNEPECATS